MLALVLAYLPLAFTTWRDAHMPGRVPTYIAQNPTDAGVYWAWIRQAAEGHFLTRNLFAPGGPPNHTVYLLFWFAGRLQALLHAPIGPFYGALTIISGAGLLIAAWWLTGRFFADPRIRVFGFSLIAISGGFGWLYSSLDFDRVPIDLSQPEATTFGSFKTPLFALSQILTILIVGNLWRSVCERSWRPLFIAVPSAALLANSHTYDVISLGAAWMTWLIVEWIRDRKIDRLQAEQTSVVAVAVVVPTALNWIALRETGVLQARALTPTPAHPPGLVLLGYGLLVPFALWGLWAPPKLSTPPDPIDSRAARFLLAWAAVPVLLQYLPTSFGRKLLMGSHLPLAMLAGVGVAAALRSSRPLVRWTTIAAFLLTALTPLRLTFEGLSRNLDQEILTRDEQRAMAWIRDHAPANAVVQPMPRFSRNGSDWDLSSSILDLLTPGVSGHSVECGHWCETPDYPSRLDAWQEFAMAETDEDDRKAILRRKAVSFLLLDRRDNPDAPDLVFRGWRVHPPEYLSLVPEASSLEVQVYRVAWKKDF